MRHSERHRTHRTGWLRAAVLGANDGIVSTASLVLGVAAAGADTKAILVAGVAGLVAGAMSMAAGEYVSVSSQSDTERADLARERKELAASPAQEHAELTAIYTQRGLDETLASSVATQLMQHDALGAHARDELGISDTLAAKPVQAALASAATFAVGAALPLVITLVLPLSLLTVGGAGFALTKADPEFAKLLDESWGAKDSNTTGAGYETAPGLKDTPFYGGSNVVAAAPKVRGWAELG